MADAVVSFALENLKNLLIHEANLFRRVKGDVNSLKNNLTIMNAFLKDSEGTGDGQDMVKELINQIRDTTFEAEDVINPYMAQVIKQRRRNLLVKLLHCFDHAVVLHRIAKKANSIKSEIEKIYADKLKYGIEAQSHVDEQAQQLLHERQRNVEEEDMVGFGDDTAKLVNQLLDRGRLQREHRIHASLCSLAAATADSNTNSNSVQLLLLAGIPNQLEMSWPRWLWRWRLQQRNSETVR